MGATERIVITGMGAVCGAGLGVEAIWDAVRSGRSASGPIRSWDARRWPVGIAAELVGVENRTLVEDRKLHKILGRTDLLGLCAAGEAVQQSGLVTHRAGLAEADASRFSDRTGVVAGSGGGTYQSQYDFFPLLTAAGGCMPVFGQELAGTVNPMWLLRNLPNNVVCHVGIRYGFKGTNGCVTNQCVGGAQAVAEAAQAIRAGEADRMVAAAHDAAVEPETVLHYQQLGLLAREALRPFDADRDGTVLGEGAAAVVLERAAGAAARQATVLGEFLGAGSTTEATGILDVRADGDGVSRAIELALADAGREPGDIGLIVAHGNGTSNSDASEARGIQRVFGATAPPVTGFKWACGHTIAASGLLDLVLGLRALRAGVVPGVSTLRRLDPDLAPFPVAAAAQAPRRGEALILCRGFGGMNVALLVGPPAAGAP